MARPHPLARWQAGVAGVSEGLSMDAQSEGFRPGDLVMAARSCEPFYSYGDVARLCRMESNGGWLMDFKDQGNRRVYMDGHWYGSPGNFVPLLGVI